MIAQLVTRVNRSMITCYKGPTLKADQQQSLPSISLSPRCSNFALKRTAEDNKLYHFHNQAKIRAYSMSTPRCVCYESDAFERKIELMEKPCTRRGILATTSSIFDLLGLIATVVLVGKQIPQEICHGRSWDESIDGVVLAKWER